MGSGKGFWIIHPSTPDTVVVVPATWWLQHCDEGHSGLSIRTAEEIAVLGRALHSVHPSPPNFYTTHSTAPGPAP